METNELKEELKSYLGSRNSVLSGAISEAIKYIDERMPQNHIALALEYIKEARTKDPNAVITELGISEKGRLYIKII